MLKDVESTDLIDLSCHWYYSTLEAREIDSMSGIVKKLSWRDVKELLEYKPSTVPIRDLAEICFSIDQAYIQHCAKQRDQNKEKPKK